MKLVWLSLAISLTGFALTGCGSGGGGNSNPPGNQNAYQQGSTNCSSEFVSDYNSVVLALKYSRTTSDLDKSQSLANDFGTKYTGVVCQLALQDDKHLDSTPTTVDANTRVTEWKNLISSMRNPNSSGTSNSTPSTPARITPPTTDSSRDVTVSNVLTLQVVDADAFNKFANSGSSTLIQNGQGTSTYSMDRSSNLCYLEMYSGTANFKAGDRISLVLRVSSPKLAGVSASQNVNLSCLKLSDQYADWKLSDFDAIFTGVATVSGN